MSEVRAVDEDLGVEGGADQLIHAPLLHALPTTRVALQSVKFPVLLYKLSNCPCCSTNSEILPRHFFMHCRGVSLMRNTPSSLGTP